MADKNIKLIKENLREKFKKIRFNFSERKKLNLDAQIQNNFLSFEPYLDDDLLLTYVSKKLEVDTFQIIKTALNLKKVVAVPKCITEKREMNFYIIKSIEDLHKGVFGVLEPDSEKCKKLTDFSHGVCIVPGFTFDVTGFRLGYGQGYYDRFLPKFQGTTVGLCYSECVVNELPHGFFDEKIKFLITEKNVKRTTYFGGKNETE